MKAALTLRPYQEEAITKTGKYLSEGKTKALLIAPTAAGKAVITAGIINRLFLKNPSARVLVLCHQGDILVQNESQLNKLNPKISTGIYCADQGRKDTTQQVIFASRDSLGRNPLACGHEFFLVLVDEAHMVSEDAEKPKTQYGKIFSAITFKYIVGLTGTPWRLKGGKIWGEGRFFDGVSYNIAMRKLIDEGYLSDYSFPPIESIIDTDGIKKTGGDFNLAELERRSSTQEIVEECCKKWLAYASDRRCSMFFCVSRAHARVVERELGRLIPKEQIAYVDGETKGRSEILDDARAGHYKAIVSIAALTTGVDIPIVDCIVFLRATHSPSLFVQAAGRGLRKYPNKNDCLILDMAGNFQRFGSLENPLCKTRPLTSGESKGTSETPKRNCPECSMVISASAKTCSFCGHIFINHGAIEWKENKQEYIVRRTTLEDRITQKKERARVFTYYTNKGVFSEYFILANAPEWKRRIYEKRVIAHYTGIKAIIGEVQAGKYIRVKETKTK